MKKFMLVAVLAVATGITMIGATSQALYNTHDPLLTPGTEVGLYNTHDPLLTPTNPA